MQTIKKIFRSEPIYPFLLGAYPVLVLWQVNYTKVNLPPVLNTLAFSILAAALLFFGLRLVFRQKHKAAAVSGIAILFSSSYGHLFPLVDKLTILGKVIGRHRYFLPVWIALAMFLILWVARSPSKMGTVTSITNTLAGLLTLLVLFQIAWFSFQFLPAAKNNLTPLPVKATVNNSAVQKPDVYYIMLDAYSRLDVLQKEFNLDNSQFNTRLISMGFVIPDCGQSNYAYTASSMGSMLNMNYLSQLGISDQQLSQIPAPESDPGLYQLAQKNTVMNVFRSLGYKIVAISSLFTNLNFSSADVFYDFNHSKHAGGSVDVQNFRSFFLQTTLLKGFYELIKADPKLGKMIPNSIQYILFPEIGISSTPYYSQYLLSQYQLDQLQLIPVEVAGPKFVFVHSLVTHHPYNFTPNGGYIWPNDDSDNGYRDQILFLNNRLPEIIQTILDHSVIPPVIIIQSDHNVRFGPIRVRNFNAYYLPGGVAKRVYKEITPVNTFRLIFSSYFNLNYPNLKDQSFIVDSPTTPSARVVTVPITCVNANN